MKYYTVFAQPYGSSAYGSSTYACAPNDTVCIQGAGTSTGGTETSGGLADTGVAVLAFASLACLIIFVALAIRLWRRPRVLAVQEAETEPEVSDDVPPTRPL